MRGKKAPKRIVNPDPKFGNMMVAKLINYVMLDGKKTIAQDVVYNAFALISEKSKVDPIDIFTQAMDNVMPNLEVKSKRVGGANYQIPMPVRGDRRISLAFRWILNASRSKKGSPMAERLASELMEAAEGTGAAVKKKEDVQRMAEANKAFAHFAR
ncbi:30S ribosomal protein S7 [Candidatus Uhrbacteria bacterium CG10_big_fil_rev_8_21_14_0_10_50_16]|uniref:Small ribosomal subunit protein uS7 n=1 Tax=Candidatus Uhrbacteria bacterium CG10_big_fil_rev_8_21_14_0_10_50_16 TaxID=1975039 RepID=A0A2H0RM19_9BACT|nr:MAG: 30S ribosomal protein S7 [Candidatus Uhrbacteria bacterium CG10_big_fil_rev_8_21_14_0_10_50_16]